MGNMQLPPGAHLFAIQVGGDSLPNGVENEFELYHILSNGLQQGYLEEHDMGILQQAIFWGEVVLGKAPADIDNDTFRTSQLNNLGIMTSGRFERTGDLEDLEPAIGYGSAVVTRIPLDHHCRPSRLCNFGGALMMKYEKNWGSLFSGAGNLSHRGSSGSWRIQLGAAWSTD
jgi:hypothetical protein